MREFFYPTSVAVIGVSPKPTNLGRNIVANLVEYGYDGIVYPVGPSGGTIETHRIYRSVVDIPDHVDLAVILTPAQTVPGVLKDCGEKGIRRAIIETAGFREYTAEGLELEKQIGEITRQYGIRFIGPNCIGAINMANGFCVPFPRLRKSIKRGGVSIITQSGGVGMSLLNQLENEGLGLSKFVSIGNVLDITAEDLLAYMIEDDETSMVFLYLESIGDGKRLMEIARRSSKPILAHKANTGRLGQNIAMSHTASLASDDRVVDAAFRQAGIIRVRDATTLGNNLKVQGLPPIKGNRLGVISRSGGHAVIAADACEESGFELAHFPDSFLREIERHFRASVIRLTNPLDLGDLFDLEVYADIIERTLQLNDVDGIVFLHTSLSDAENMTSRLLLERIDGLVQKYQKPVAYDLSATTPEIDYLKQTYSFPVFTQVVETVRALEISRNYARQHEKALQTQEVTDYPYDAVELRQMVEKALVEKRDLRLDEALQAAAICGIPALRGEVVHGKSEALQAAHRLGYPLAMKVIAGEISHKSDAGGVRLNLKDDRMLTDAYDQMLSQIAQTNPQARIDGILLQPMLSRGVELILGGRQDPQFGPVVLLGLGGIFVEVFNQVVVWVAPLNAAEAEEMIASMPGSGLLQGLRGQPPADIQALKEAVLRLSQLLSDFPEIKEIDLNPIRVLAVGEGIAALDARVILRQTVG